MGVPPGLVRDTVLARLMAPMPAAPRKRVTLLYRPVDAGQTASLVDRDRRAAINRTGRRKGQTYSHDTASLRSGTMRSQNRSLRR